MKPTLFASSMLFTPSTLSRRPAHRPDSRGAVVLIVVLVVISLLSLAGLTFSQLMTAEREATELAGRQIQARALAESGQEAARMFLGLDREVQLDSGSWYDNPGVFQGVVVIDDNRDRKRGRFTLLAPLLENGVPSGVRYGLEDESARLNLNTLLEADESADPNEPSSTSARDILLGLPGMDEQIADAILDWIDEDDEPREFGAEVDSYSSLDPPYAPKNGPLETIEELLLVQGVTPELLFGVDANRNRYADTGESDPQSLDNVDNSDGAMDAGWAAYLTLHAVEANLRPDGTPKIDLNQSDMKELYNELSEVFDTEQATYIVAYRQNGPYQGSKQPAGQQPAGSLDLSAKAKVEIQTVLDLVGQNVEAKFQKSKNAVVLSSPFANDPTTLAADLPSLMENVHGKGFSGRVNINQAPRTVLECIPGMTIDLVDQVLSQRLEDPLTAESNPSLACAAWPLLDGMVELDQMKQMLPMITAEGAVYRAQIVGYFDRDGPAARIEVIFDTTNQPATIVSWKDQSHLGRGYSREVLGTESTGL